MVGQSKEDIHDCKSLRDIAMATNFGQNRQKNLKNDPITSVVWKSIGSPVASVEGRAMLRSANYGELVEP